MLHRHLQREAKADAGFTLIELLVVVIIIGILATIAIPTFLNQRRKAWQSQTVADLHHAGLTAEDYFADNNTYAGLAVGSLVHSDGVTLMIVDASAVNVCIEADNEHLNGTGTADFHIDTPAGKPLPGACPP